MISRLTLGLTPVQIATVTAVFFATGIGALLLAVAFRRWNKRRAV